MGAQITTSIRRLDRSLETAVLLDYGMRVARDPSTGLFTPTLSPDACSLTVRAEFGRFPYDLVALDASFDAFATLAPGESGAISFDYFARAKNGVGETGYFAAIGDPFHITGSGGRWGFNTVDGLDPATTALGRAAAR